MHTLPARDIDRGASRARSVVEAYYLKMEVLTECVRDGFRSLSTHPTNVFLGVIGISVAIYVARKYFGGGVCYSKATLHGKTVIITGANTGIGLETAVDLAKRGARVVLACRSVEKGQAAVEAVKSRSKNENVVFVKLDLASLKSVRDFSDRILQDEAHIDILINNAGSTLHKVRGWV